MTYTGLLLGVAAMAVAPAGRIDAAGALIGLAAIADTLDGRFARCFPADDDQRAIGSELDSLCDACTFGIAPTVCTATLATAWWQTAIGWSAGALYLVAVLTRLAYYNVTSREARGFIGLPAPAAALLWTSALCCTRRIDILAAVLVVAAFAMVAPWRLPRPSGSGLLLFLLWPATVAARLLAI